MKKIYLLGLLCAFCLMAKAQYPANRTTKTIIADILAQMPAGQAEQYNAMMKDLVSTGESGVFQLVSMLGTDNNASAEYALSGLSYYVSAGGQESAHLALSNANLKILDKGLETETRALHALKDVSRYALAEQQESDRLAISNAYLKVMDTDLDKETKAFIIRQLQIVGKNEAVPKLASYLNDNDLSGPASRALASIETDNSAQALLKALGIITNERSKKNIIEALGKIQTADAEKILLPMFDSDDENMQKIVLYALSRTGSQAPLNKLSLAAEKVQYSMEKTGATEAYIALIKRILAHGGEKPAKKAASGLMKKAEQVNVRSAALQILLAANPANRIKLISNALKDGNREYRVAALNFISLYADKPLYEELLKIYEKSGSEVKTDILYWLCREADCPKKLTIIKEIGSSPFMKRLPMADPGLKDATAHLLAQIGDNDAIVVLSGLLNSADKQTVSLGENLLSTVSGDILTSVLSVIPTASDEGKMAGLRLLANRKSTANAGVVMSQVNNSSPEVQAVAFTALKDVVSSRDLPTLYNMLENSTSNAVLPVQQAIIAALKETDRDTRLTMITRQMDKTSPDKQQLYYPLLASTGHAKALEIISTMFTQQAGSMKDAAFQALLDWKGHEAAGQLLAICKTPSTTDYFDRALQRYIQLASASDLTGENRRLLLTNAMEIAKTDTQKNEILKQLAGTNSYLAMLLAGEYLDEKAVQQAAAQAVMSIALNNKSFTGRKVKLLLKKVIDVLDNPDAGYQKEAIGKHLGEMPDEEGFVSIFNGKDLTGWKGLVDNPLLRAKMTPAQLAKAQKVADEQMEKDWKAESGCLIFDGAGFDNLCSVKQYGDIEMYVDWCLDPNGDEADAGIYLRGTPQVQIWDTARVNVGAQVGSGGLYNNEKNPSIPLKVVDNRLGEWNTFYIRMVGDRVTVMLNGELVVDNIILENFWDRSLPIFPKEQIELQAHGSKVYYRNIYVKELAGPTPFELSAEEKKEGFSILFDGTNMHSWTGNTVDYVIQDGTITLNPKGGHGGNLYTKEEFSDFIFRFEFQLTPAANNGLGIRTPQGGDAAYVGMELQILDNDAPVYSQLEEYQYHGSVYGIIPAKRGFLKSLGEWNYQEVVAKGDHIRITLNGTVILDGNIRDAVKDGIPDKKEHPGLFNKKGHIGFLGHGSLVKFRNIRIRELK